MLRGDSQDVALVILSVITTLLVFGNFVAMIIYEFRDNLKHKEIKYEDFNYKLRLFLRKSLIIIYEAVFLVVYTMIIFYGRNNIGVNDLWVALVFSPMLVFISHLLYLIELKTLNDFKINIL
jgi:amino acid permease